MVDPGTGLTILGSALGSAKLVEKLFGPTAELYGGDLRKWVERRQVNARRIIENATQKLGPKIDEPGSIPPKVLKTVLGDGSYANDEVVIEYLGGILASSRSERGRDDRGARIAKIVESLSTYQIRMHYLLYATLHSVFSRPNVEIGEVNGDSLRIYVPYSSLVEAMDFSGDEVGQEYAIISHALWGTYNEVLIGRWWLDPSLGPVFRKEYPAAKEGGLVYCYSAQGLEVFQWAFGKRGQSEAAFFRDDFSTKIDGIACELRFAAPIRHQL
jgi:hypothetical protein